MKKAEHTSKTILTPYISNIIKIIALLMMFCHHFLRTDSWLVNGNRYISLLTIRGYQMETILCDVGKLCVALFAVLSGYGLYHSFNKNDSFGRVLQRLRDFICQYLVIFLLVFTPAFFLLGNRITLWGFVKSLLTLDANMNMFSWYVLFYIMAVPALWLLHKLYAVYPEFEKPITATSLLMIVLLPFVKVTWGGCLVSDFLSYFPSILVGYFTAKYMLMERLGRLVEYFRWKKCLGLVGGDRAPAPSFHFQIYTLENISSV